MKKMESTIRKTTREILKRRNKKQIKFSFSSDTLVMFQETEKQLQEIIKNYVNKTSADRLLNISYSDEFAAPNAKIGTSLRIKLPK